MDNLEYVFHLLHHALNAEMTLGTKHYDASGRLLTDSSDILDELINKQTPVTITFAPNRFELAADMGYVSGDN